MNLEGFKEKVGALGVLGVVVTQDGEEKAKYFWEEEYRRNIYSASKSFTSCAVGFAVGIDFTGREAGRCICG